MRDLFVHHMNAMREHYKSGATHAYPLPISMMVGASLSGAEAPPSQETKDAISAAETSMTEFADNQQAVATTATEQLKTDKESGKSSDASAADFTEQMEKSRADAKTDANNRIDEMYDNLIDAGTKRPEEQSFILGSTQLLGAYFTNLLVQIGNFFADIAKKIVEWFKSVAEWFEKAGKEIEDWFVDAGDSISDFFSKTFSWI